MTNKSKVNIIDKTGQYVVTIPRAIGQGMRLKKGDYLEWIIDRGDIMVRKV